MSRLATMPRSRTEQLVIQQLAGETLVYDLDRHKAHCLNESAAVVWSLCDGRTTMNEAAKTLHARLGTPADVNVVHLALNQLGKARLLDDEDGKSVAAINPGRRELMKRIGIAGGVALALPLVTSIIAPPAALAATCIANGNSCVTSATCCSGRCGGSPKKCF